MPVPDFDPPLRAVFFDLDDTLLENDMAVFGPAYLDLFARRCVQLAPREVILAALDISIRDLLRHDDPEVTNEARFWATFLRESGLAEAELRPCVDQFCADDVSLLRGLTRPRPEARGVVRQVRARGWTVVLATNPMFPTAVTLQRIAWAGLEAGDFDLVTTLENSHACKPNPAYFRALLDFAGVSPAEALFVGDDWGLDITPAHGLGLRTFGMLNRGTRMPVQAWQPDAAGAWEDFLAWWGDS